MSRNRYVAAGAVVVVTGVLLVAWHAWSRPQVDLTDAYFWSKGQGNNGTLVLQPVGTGDARELPVAEVVQANLYGTQVCALDIDRKLWGVALPSGDVEDHGHLSPDVPMQILADRHSQCLFPHDATHLGIALAGQRDARSIAIRGDGFAWTSLDYVPGLDMLAVVGEKRFAVVADVAGRSTIDTVEAHGHIDGLTVDGLSCCAKLSPDGHTLYAMAGTTDANFSGRDVIAAFDTGTGEIKRIYLPHFVDPASVLADCIHDHGEGADSQSYCETDTKEHPGEVVDANGATVEIIGEPQSFALSADGAMLYVRAVTGVVADDSVAERIQIVAIDTRSGAVTALPVVAHGAFAITASGNYLLAEHAVTVTSLYLAGIAAHGAPVAPTGPDDERIQAYALPGGKLAHAVPGQNLVGSAKKDI